MKENQYNNLCSFYLANQEFQVGVIVEVLPSGTYLFFVLYYGLRIHEKKGV